MFYVLHVLLWVITCYCIHPSIAVNNGTYLQQRAKLLLTEHSMRTGGKIELTDKEKTVNTVLMNHKSEEIRHGKKTGFYPAALHFFYSKAYIEDSEIYDIVRRMPKGAALSLHDVTMVDVDWLVKNVTYRPNAYMCFDQTTGKLHFHFFNTLPMSQDCPWKTLESWRLAYGNTTEFDEVLYRHMTLNVPDPHKAYPTQNIVWQKFLDALDSATGLIMYAPVFKDYFYEALKEFYEDNVQYIEVRCLLSEVYELDGTTHDKDWIVETYSEVAEKFVKDFPDFSGAKIIYSVIRNVPKVDVGLAVKEAIRLHQKYPMHFVGFDLVGQEDPGHPLLYYLNELLYPSQQNPPIDLKYFFHAGETDWEGTHIDNNLIDALLLNSSRIGHGFAITKHPEALELIREKDVPLEVNPISNQVLGLLDDLRVHPASFLLANGYPVVISSDDPSVWGATGLSDDFYEVFMGVAGENADLATMKQLALDSIRYSAMTDTEKKAAVDLFNSKWMKFIDETIQKYVKKPVEIYDEFKEVEEITGY
ncbi:adenosine deaminase 2 isoform X2 [Lingula anatina]|uniref:adenosine deaminase n=1 Tax=Lingula anatina TaxID=7574 RepID=A0A1S3IFH1_LINAN|nr:adenosine deaminase 2 isoform X2 [Lingula anatina]|eukprot:XP_013397015.1 adenosine deaminase 2 isoform X2 [Lingula anatina]